MKKVVFIGSEAGDHAIQIGIQAGLIQSAYQGSSSVQFVSYPQTLLADLPLRVANEQPDILHLTCHGTEGEIWLSRSHGDPKAADLQSPTQLAQMLNFGGDKVVFIDACHSASIAEFLFGQAHLQVRLAIGYAGDISVNASQEGARALHERLAGGATYAEALAAMKPTVHALAGSDLVRCFADAKFLADTLVPQPPRLVARFMKGHPPQRDRHGDYHVEFGVLGLPLEERNVVSIFSDDGTLVDGGFFTLVSGFPQLHVGPDAKPTSLLWTHDYAGTAEDGEIWVVDGNFNVFACCVHAGAHAIVKSNLREALGSYYLGDSFSHAKTVRGQATKTLDQLK